MYEALRVIPGLGVGVMVPEQPFPSPLPPILFKPPLNDDSRHNFSFQ